MTNITEKSKKQLLEHINELENYIKSLKIDLVKAQTDIEKINHVKSVFLSNISHEIRTPMNGIIGMYNVLKQTKLTEEQKDFLDIINISGQNLLSIIDDILDLSKIESGKLELESKLFSINDEIEKIVNLLIIKSKGKGIKLIYKRNNNIPKYVYGDASRFKQILINLTNNAIKYTKDGSVTINTELIKTDNKHIFLKFSIIDTGIGITKENQVKLFKSFSQIDSSTTRKYGGTGLGLAISKNLTKIMGGKIGVESSLDKGSIFWFTLKFDNVPKDEVYLISKVDTQESNLKKLSVLIVEDNLLNQKFASATLIKQGHKVKIAENGMIAVEKFNNNKFDIILMDIQMPVMDGIDATKEIRRIEKMKNVAIDKQVYIIAVTAYVFERDRKMCLAAGMDEYLTKPYKPLDLIQLIEKIYSKAK
ncbi:MAG: response regulator [Bacteroidales bacterium]|nr:response regulator [Bacteroidales bacterium]